MPVKKRVTMKQVAARAGVSLATVSYVLNGRSGEVGLDPVTDAKVRSVAARLGYRLPETAGHGRRQVGVLFPHVRGNYRSQLLTTIQQTLRAHGYQAVLSLCDNQAETELHNLREFVRRRVSGMLVFPYDPAALATLGNAWWRTAPPAVFLDHAPTGITPAECVGVDQRQVGREGADVLWREGCRRFILVIDDDTDPEKLAARRQGFQARLREQGQPPARELVWRDYNRVLDALARAPARTGVFGLRNTLFLPTLYLGLQRGLVLRPDLVLACAGWVQEAYAIHHLFWMAELPTKEMGQLAVERLLHRIGEPTPSPTTMTLNMHWTSNLFLERDIHKMVLG